MGKDTYAYGWRDYDPAIGRFNKIDRFSEKYYSLSTYSYAGNNPIYFVDVQGDSIASGSSTRKANRIERRAERRADRLDRQADRREARGQDVADLRERSSELRQSGQDIRDMRADTKNMYRFASATGREAKKLKLAGPATTKTGTTKSGLNEITLFTESNMGNRLHETRHGGQHSRGEINAVTQSHGALGLNAEVSAYRAQYSWDGSLNYYSHNIDQTDFVNRTLLDNRSFNFAIRNINNINQINLNMVRDIGEVFDASGMSLPASINGTFWILPLYSN